MNAMTNPTIITFMILGIAVILLLSDRVRPDLVAIMVMLSLGLTGVITVQETFSGIQPVCGDHDPRHFHPGRGAAEKRRVRTIRQLAAAAGQRRGAPARQRSSIGWRSPFTLYEQYCRGGCLTASGDGRFAQDPPSPARLLIPLAFGTILGGMATLFTTSNIIASSLLPRSGPGGLRCAGFSAAGDTNCPRRHPVPGLDRQAAAPQPIPAENRSEIQAVEDNLAEVYRLKERLVRARLPAGSALAGKRLGQSSLRETYQLNLIAIERNGQGVFVPSAETIIEPGDQLLLSGRPEAFSQPSTQSAFILMQEPNEVEPRLESPTIELIEAVLAPRSTLINQTLREMHFREKYEMNVIAIWRAGRPIRTALSEIPLQFGDALLMLGPRSRIKLLRSEPNLILLHENEHHHAFARRKALAALAIMGFSIMPVHHLQCLYRRDHVGWSADHGHDRYPLDG